MRPRSPASHSVPLYPVPLPPGGRWHLVRPTDFTQEPALEAGLGPGLSGRLGPCPAEMSRLATRQDWASKGRGVLSRAPVMGWEATFHLSRLVPSPCTSWSWFIRCGLWLHV